MLEASQERDLAAEDDEEADEGVEEERKQALPGQAHTAKYYDSYGVLGRAALHAALTSSKSLRIGIEHELLLDQAPEPLVLSEQGGSLGLLIRESLLMALQGTLQRDHLLGEGIVVKFEQARGFLEAPLLLALLNSVGVTLLRSVKRGLRGLALCLECILG